MVYRVSNLVSDCSTGRGRLKISGAGKRDAYAAVWDCLCKWIVDQYQRGKVRRPPTLALRAHTASHLHARARHADVRQRVLGVHGTVVCACGHPRQSAPVLCVLAFACLDVSRFVRTATPQPCARAHPSHPLAHAQGVFIPNFCRLGWEIVPTMAGGNRQAPYFELTDHFLRSHGLPVRRNPKPMQRAHEGEINFIKLAIKCVVLPACGGCHVVATVAWRRRRLTS